MLKVAKVGYDSGNFTYRDITDDIIKQAQMRADDANFAAQAAGKEGVGGKNINNRSPGGINKDALEIEGAIKPSYNPRFSYKNNPMDNPRAAADIIENPDAVYGYSPKPNSPRIGEFARRIDWTDPNQVEIARQSRIAYHEENQQMLRDLYRQGYSPEEIARRIANRLYSYLRRGDVEGYEIVRKSNLTTYKNADGPTPEFLFDKYGSWEGVINASLRSNPGMDACVGLYDLYYGGK